jgi:hypothetical protein
MNYIEWNRKIYDFFFNDLKKDKWVVISANLRTIKLISENNDDPFEDLLKAIKEGPIDPNPRRFDYGNIRLRGQKPNILKKAFWLMKAFKEGYTYQEIGLPGKLNVWGESEVPPYVAYIFFLVYLAETLEGQDDNSYWNTLNNVLNDRLTQDGIILERLFSDLKKFSERGEKGRFYFQSIYSQWKYVGIIYSQLPFTLEEENRIVSYLKFIGYEKSKIAIADDNEKFHLLEQCKNILNSATAQFLNKSENHPLKEIIEQYF